MIIYLIQDIGRGVVGIRSKSSQENRSCNLVRILLHGHCQTHASKAVTNQYHLFIWRKTSHGLQQRFWILYKRENLLDFPPVDPGRGHVEHRYPVAGRLQQRLDLVPAPSPMANSMDQHKMLLQPHLCHIVIICLPLSFAFTKFLLSNEVFETWEWLLKILLSTTKLSWQSIFTFYIIVLSFTARTRITL